jgi:hypothetical protein
MMGMEVTALGAEASKEREGSRIMARAQPLPYSATRARWRRRKRAREEGVVVAASSSTKFSRNSRKEESKVPREAAADRKKT